ncbi:MAG TPA: 30S ribosomal protein S9, partial [Anaerolineales bacterium]|nr:30S ribosomal protein S9 [Anaerolineales bacterium]
NFTVNGKGIAEYFPRTGDVEAITAVFSSVDHDQGRYDVTVKVGGGGVTGQRDAVKLGLARAFVKFDEQLQPRLKRGDFLTRDPREKERKKPGLKRARKAPTYTKR